MTRLVSFTGLDDCFLEVLASQCASDYAQHRVVVLSVLFG